MLTDTNNEEICQSIRSEGDPDGSKRLALLQRNIGFIKSQWRVYSGIVSEEELQSIAFLAVDSAVKTCDPSKGSFIQALSWSLRNELFSAVQQNAQVHLSSAIRAEIRAYSRLVKDYYAEHGKRPPDSYILDQMGITADHLMEIKKGESALYPDSLNRPVSEDPEMESVELGDTIPDNTDVSEDVTAKCFADQLAEFVEGILQTLPKEEKVFLNLKFYERRSIPEISQTLKKQPTEVRNLQSKIYKHLRRNTQLQAFFDQENCYLRTGLTRFRITGESEPEFLAIRLYEKRKRDDD